MPSQVIVNALRNAGILAEATKAKGTLPDGERFRCCRKPASFVLTMWSEDQRQAVMLSADTSAYRWYNFPFVWLLAALRTRQEIRLQKDAKRILIGLGGKQVAGYDMDPNQVPEDTARKLADPQH